MSLGDELVLVGEEEEERGVLSSPTPLLHDLMHKRLWSKILNVCETFPEEAAKVDGRQHATALHEACAERAPVTVIYALLQAYPPAAAVVDWLGRTALHVACEKCLSGNVVGAIARSHPKALIVKSKYGATPLHLACTHGASVDAVRVLILLSDSKTFLQMENIEKYTPLHFACHRNASAEVIRVLVQYCPESITMINQYGYTPLHFACLSYNIDVIQLFLDAAPEAASFVNNVGNTPLHMVCQRPTSQGSLEIMRALVRCYPGALMMQNYGGFTPLHLALRCGASTHTLEFLVAEAPEALLMGEARRGFTPLHHMCTKPRPNMEHLWLITGACPPSVFCKTRLGKTPLFLLANQFSNQDTASTSTNMNHVDDAIFMNTLALDDHDANLWEAAVLLIKVAHQISCPDAKVDDTLDYILHTALRVDGCSSSLVRFIVGINPEYVRLRDSNGDLPLHIEATVVREGNDCKTKIFSYLLSCYPESAQERNGSGKLPLTLLREHKKVWETGIKTILMAYPVSIHSQDLDLRLYPTLLHRVAKDTNMSTLYEIIRSGPELIQSQTSSIFK